MSTNIDFLRDQEEEARRRLHWYLSKAALGVLSIDGNPAGGRWLDEQIALIQRARDDLQTLRAQIFKCQLEGADVD